MLPKDVLLFASKVVAVNPPARYGRVFTVIWCVFLLCLACGVTLFFKSLPGQLATLVKFSLWLQLLGQTTIVLVDYFTVVIKPENFRPPTKELRKIEATVIRFGFIVNDRDLNSRLSILELVLCFGIPFGFGFLDVIDIIKGINFPYLPIYFVHYVYALTVINITEFLFVNNLYMIKRRFEELNRIIADVGYAIIARGDGVLNKFDDQRILEQLCIVKKAHYALTEVAHQVNNSYGTHLLLSMTFSIILITEQLYQNYEAITHHGRTIVESLYTNYTWTGYHMARISLVVFACYFTSAEANKTMSIIHGIPIQKSSQKLKDELFHFSLQVQEQLSFTAAGFFDMNLNSFTSVTGSVITYLLIMIQMEDNNHPGVTERPKALPTT